MPLEVKIPNVAESITEVTLAQWLVEDGDYVEMDQPLVEVETDKASQELFAEKAGVITLKIEEGEDIAVGTVIAEIDTEAEAPAGSDKKEEPKKEEKAEAPKEEKKEEKKEAPKTEKEEKKSASYASGHPSPAAAKMIAEHDLDASKISGSGKDGRITKEDVQNAIESGSATMQGAYKALIKQAPANSREESRKKVSRLRRTISDRLVYAKNSTAMLTTFNEVDMSPVMEIREKFKEKFKEQHQIGLGFMSFFSRACALALQKFPAVNAYLEDDHIVYHDYVDISIAVSTPKGLVVPVIRNVESLSMAGIEKEVKRLAIRGRDGELTVDEMTGGTFTITNGGVFGSLLSTPIINPPQSAILGMHKIEERPIAVNGKVEIRPMMYVALSYDHRIIDGKESVSFLVAVKDYLEHPEKMLTGDNPVQMLLGL
jgi:2-oxoglutarate dehydrogenase E2 component (dihydrolipoamide succinyltransferase)